MEHNIAVLTQGLCRRFGTHVALRDLDLALPPGEIFGLLGPNGAGKSTTLNILMGMLRPTAGRAEILGMDCTLHTRDVMPLVGHLPEEPSLFENLTGRETLSFVLSMRGTDKAQSWQRAEKLSNRLGFSRELDLLVAGYSMGMRKKLALILALAHSPRVLLLDEPTNGLDPLVAREVRSLLFEERDRGVTVVLSTHLLDVAERTCDRLGVLVEGSLRALGTPREIITTANGANSLEEAFLALSARP